MKEMRRVALVQEPNGTMNMVLIERRAKRVVTNGTATQLACFLVLKLIKGYQNVNKLSGGYLAGEQSIESDICAFHSSVNIFMAVLSLCCGRRLARHL